MRGIWIKSAVLMVGMTLSGTALLAQQATAPVPEATTQSAASATGNVGSVTGKPQLTAEQKKQLRIFAAPRAIKPPSSATTKR